MDKAVENTAEDILAKNVEASIQHDYKSEADIENSEIDALLEEATVRPEENIEDDEFLFCWCGVDFMPRTNIISLKAPAKAGKTFVLTALSLAFLSGEYQGLKCYAETTDTILFVDTEQSRNDTRKVIRRIGKRVEDLGRITFLNVRNYETKQRIRMIDRKASLLKPALIVIDGIADLVKGMDYNDNSQADEIITHLSSMAEKHKSVVICAIHVNKNDNFATGWLGRLLLQKCALELSLNRVDKTAKRTLEPSAARSKEMPPITMEIVDTEDNLGELRIIPQTEVEEDKAAKKKDEQKTRLRDFGLETGVYSRSGLYEKLKKGYEQVNCKKPSGAWATNTVTRACEAGALRVDGDNFIFDD